jgi:lipopolysaccharide/colanic/teichoic acid biosynthesis glycosyltransferase
MNTAAKQKSEGTIGPETAGGVPGWKRALDIALIVLALPWLLPLMIGIVLLIRLASKGPILFKQQRIGRHGKPFMCYKFRTMIPDNDSNIHRGHLKELMESGKPMVKMDAHGDPRIIRFGAPLRSSGLDELPQLINVLKGEMSLVGPRPCVIYEYERYQAWQKERFNAVPGLTGLWQVSGKNKTTFEEMIRLDITYSRNATFWLDCAIILKTVPALVVQVLETRRMKRQKAKASVRSVPSAAISAGAVPAMARTRNFEGVLQTDGRR